MRNWQRKGEWLEWIVPKEINPAEDMTEIGPVGGSYLKKLLRSGGVSVKGSRIRLRLFPKEPLHDMHVWSDLDILYEDAFCLVANKPSGMKVHPTQEGEEGTLLHAVSAHLLASGESCRPRHIHRLDEDTTGPVLYAKYEWPQIRLDAMMREKAIGRQYVALVQGRLRQAKGRVEAPIGRDRHHATRRRVSPAGEAAVTYYEVVEQLNDAALVRLTLETGRTHQIRVHMSHLGHPLWGDTLYGGRTQGMSRQALHGERLRFPHPFTEDIVEVEAPWPADMTSLYERLKK